MLEECQYKAFNAVRINLEKDLGSFVESMDIKQVSWEFDRIF